MDNGIQIITKETLEGLKNGTKLRGVVLIQSYQTKMTKHNKPYLCGSIQSDVTMEFKCWDSSQAYSKMSAEDYKGVVAFVDGDAQEYQGVVSLLINDVVAVEGYDSSLFLKKRYNPDVYMNALRSNYVDKFLSPKGKEIFEKVFTPYVVCKFMQEFAALSHHDNCVGGLLAHTYKVAMFGELVIQLYPNMFKVSGSNDISQDRIDLFVLGILMHDIGKIYEMTNGVYQPCSRVTHRILGVEMLSGVRQDIIDAYGETGYYDLVSILVQHHDEYDDKARTVLAKAVFLLDNLESKFMGIQQTLEEKVQGSDGDARIFFDGSYLYV